MPVRSSLNYYSLKRIRDEQAVLSQKLDDAKHEGILIDEEKGEMKAKIAVVKNSLKAGVSIDVISETSGLSVDEIKKLI